MKRTKLWGILLLCVLLALPVFGLAGEGQATELVVGTFNVDVKAPEQLVTEQRDLLAAKNVEIFGIQEVDRLLPRYEQETYDPLEDFTQGAYVDSFFGMSIAKGTGGGGYGNAIVSAFPLSDPTVTELYGAAQAPQELQEQIYAVYGMWGTGDPAFGEAMMGLWGEGGAMSQGGIEPRS